MADLISAMTLAITLALGSTAPATQNETVVIKRSKAFYDRIEPEADPSVPMALAGPAGGADR